MTRIAYFGLPLGALLLGHDGLDVALAVLSPIDAPGRRRLVGNLGDRVLDARAFEDASELEGAVDRCLAALRPDLIVSWYFTRRLPKRWLDVARLGALGVHPSLLPRHRGPNPFFAAIDEGDDVTGVTVHRLVERYDEGDILATETLPIGDRNSWELARALDRPSLRLLREVVARIDAGDVPEAERQDETFASWAPEPTGALLRVDWSWSTERILRRVRALSPVPGLALSIRGVEVFVTVAERAAEFPSALVPGEAGVTPAGVVIRTGTGAILLLRATADSGSDQPTELHVHEIAERVSDSLS